MSNRCGLCVNCRTIKRWDDVLYKPYLEKHPEGKTFIEGFRTTDNRILGCQRNLEEGEPDWQDFLAYEDAEEVLTLSPNI